MTALEQKLLDELEQLEAERENEVGRLRALKSSYEQSIKELSSNLASKYQQSLTELMQSENSEQESLIAYLQTLTEQQRQIIQLLKKPPVGDSFKEALDDALADFSRRLTSSLTESNRQLVEEIKDSLQEL